MNRLTYVLNSYVLNLLIYLNSKEAVVFIKNKNVSFV